ncbi:DUF6234 family protein [Streptomyces sp. NPDC047024]|uniref:DUF6234 family protein n=1 Tax=Streptomyces sp. NPDC047024 TaxID=3155476 RepID=UPI0034039833
MTQSHPASPAQPRWPWSRRTPTPRDLGVALLLLVAEAGVVAGVVLEYGMRFWGAQGEQWEIDAIALAEIAWLRYTAVAVTVCAGLALLCRARWTVASQVLAAVAVGALLTHAQRDWDRAHPAPAPTPTVRYVPCYSGSGTCE